MRFTNYVLCILAILSFGACSNEASESESLSKPFQFIEQLSTRATETSFEEGDVIGVYAVIRNGDEIGTIQPNGNFADNKKYIYRSGHFSPVAPADMIYPPAGQKLDFYAYYPCQNTPAPTELITNSSISQKTVSNYKESDHLLAKSERGYINSQSPISLPFSHIMGLVEVTIQKNEADIISTARIATAMTEQHANLQTGNITLASSSQQAIDMLLYDETDTQYIFRALVPDGNVFLENEENLQFILNTGITKKFIPKSNLPIQSGKITRLNLDIRDVITYGDWAVSVSASPETISGSGGTSTISANATRDVFTNGVKTDTENTTPTLSASGAGFSLSGITLTAAGNNASSSRSCVVAASHGGASNTCTVTQSAAVVTYSEGIEIFASPETISAAGGTSTVSARIYYATYTNGIITDSYSESTEVWLKSDAPACFSLSGTTLSVSRNLGAARSCWLTAGRPGGVGTYSRVYQAAADDVVTYGNWAVSVSASPITISASGGTSTISANATRDVFTNGVKTSTENTTPTLSSSGYGFSLSGTTLRAGNNSGSSRSCTVTASHGGVSNTCTVTQAAAADVVTYGNWAVSVSASPTTISASGGTSTISANASRSVYTNGVKTSTENATPTLSASGTGFSLSGTTLSAGNNSGAARSCTVTASHGGVSSSCSVTQGIVNATWQYSLTVTPNSLSFASSGETKSFTVTSKRTKIVNGVSTGIAEDAPYTSAISGANASAFSVSGTSVVAKDNPTADFRDGLLTITQVGTDGKSATITLEQEGKIDIGTEI